MKIWDGNLLSGRKLILKEQYFIHLSKKKKNPEILTPYSFTTKKKQQTNAQSFTQFYYWNDKMHWIHLIIIYQ